MSGTGKKSIFEKIQKSPALLVFIVVLLAVALFLIAHISSAIREKTEDKPKIETTETVADSTENETTLSQKNENLSIPNLKIHSTDVVAVSKENTDNGVALKVEFKDENSLMTAHSTQNINDSQAVPYFCFGLKDGTLIKCPADVRFLGDGKTAVYSLTEIGDYANAVALTEDVTVTAENILDDGFSLFLFEKNSGNATALFGTDGKTVNFDSANVKANVTWSVAGVKNIEITKNDEFVWIDVYYDGVSSYMKLNNDFVTNFVRFGFEKDGVSYKRDFITTEYDNLNMVRCKFDSYSLDGLAKEMGVADITVSELFTDYTISVWTSDYDKDTNLFKLN